MNIQEIDEKEYDALEAVELTPDEFHMLVEAYEKGMEKLSEMTLEERIEWFRKTGFPNCCSFEKEIGGTVYTVNAVFNHLSDITVNKHIKNFLERENI